MSEIIIIIFFLILEPRTALFTTLRMLKKSKYGISRRKHTDNLNKTITGSNSGIVFFFLAVVSS